MVRTALQRGMLGIVLTVAVVCPVTAQADQPSAEPPSEAHQPQTMAEAAAAALLHALEVAPSVIWPDAPAPPSVAAYVPVAREQLRGNAIDRRLWPLHLRFVEARCGRDGAVALIYEEIRPLLPRTFAYAARGSMPTSTTDSWAGGTGMVTVLDDPEFTRLMGPQSGACP